ncbi:hypothetical protein COLO4_19687 [Corchorus olitorius]|uniref:Uncharacterized protein n=1 Tax=Corchorus olitorius TaxID=93759 RepID=A0A1R3J411_9ROSI|nr:hypothetical protein COLO4_19687 [Corchorus olitorius]
MQRGLEQRGVRFKGRASTRPLGVGFVSPGNSHLRLKLRGMYFISG